MKDQLVEKNKQLRIQNYNLTKYKYQLEEKKKKVTTLRKQVLRLNKNKIKLQEVVKNSNKKIDRLLKEKMREVSKTHYISQSHIFSTVLGVEVYLKMYCSPFSTPFEVFLGANFYSVFTLDMIGKFQRI